MYEYDIEKFNKIKNLMDPNILDTTEMRVPKLENNAYHFHKDEEYLDGYIYTPLLDLQETNNGGSPFTYRINRHGFRSQHFENFNPANKNILFAGCSNTSGIGLPYNLMWSTILTNKIKEALPDDNVQAYGVGIGGASIPFIFKNVMSFLRKYDGVDYVYILLPGFDRHVAFDEDNYPPMFKKIVYMGPHEENFKLKFVKRFVTNYSHEEAMFMQLPLIKAIEDICKLKNIKLVWSTWRTTDQEIYQSYGFDNYCNIPLDVLDYNMSIRGDYNYEKVARDNQHPGSEWMTGVAKTFYNASFGE